MPDKQKVTVAAQASSISIHVMAINGDLLVAALVVDGIVTVPLEPGEAAGIGHALIRASARVEELRAAQAEAKQGKLNG